MIWGFSNPVHVTCGPGSRHSLKKEDLAAPVLLLTSAGTQNRGGLAFLGNHGFHICAEIESNPSLTTTQALAETLRPHGFKTILAIGGGSVIDSAKILSACLSGPSNWSLAGHLLENQSWHGQSPIPIYALPTTAGTGAEVTPFATVWHKETCKKLSLSHPSLFAKQAIIDSEFLLGSPRSVIVSCGLDALSQALESLWNRNSTPLTDHLAQRAVKLALAAILPLSQNPQNSKAAEQMAEASLLAGLCISQTRTALAHAISYPLTARFGVPHGLACGITLPAILRFNSEAEKLSTLATEQGFCSLEALAQHLEHLLIISGAKADFHSLVPNFTAVEPFIPEMLLKERSDNNLRPASLSDIATLLQSWNSST